MLRDHGDDIPLVAERLRLGIPLTGLDGRDIPLRDAEGRPYTAVEAALLLLASGTNCLPPEEAHEAMELALARATEIEDSIPDGGPDARVRAARITGVLVSAAVRAAAQARLADPSPTAINQAILSWFEVQRLRAQQLLVADASGLRVDRIA